MIRILLYCVLFNATIYENDQKDATV